MTFGVSPKVTPKIAWKVAFWPDKWLRSGFSGSKSYFWGYFGGDPESHFLVTFVLLLVFRGFGASRRSAASQCQHHKCPLKCRQLISLVPTFEDRNAGSCGRELWASVAGFLSSAKYGFSFVTWLDQTFKSYHQAKGVSDWPMTRESMARATHILQWKQSGNTCAFRKELFAKQTCMTWSLV